jgi:UDP-N-acetylglucosamine 2-epimerase (non-hydrolysing)
MTSRVRQGNKASREIVGLDSSKIRNGVDTILAGKWKAGRLPQLWDGPAAQRIVEILKTRLLPVVKQNLQ